MCCTTTNFTSFINLVFYIPQMVLVIFILFSITFAIMEKMRKEEMLLRDNILTKLYTEVSEPLSKN